MKYYEFILAKMDQNNKKTELKVWDLIHSDKKELKNINLIYENSNQNTYKVN